MKISEMLLKKKAQYVNMYCLRPDYCVLSHDQKAQLRAELAHELRHDAEDDKKDVFCEMVIITTDEEAGFVGRLI